MEAKFTVTLDDFTALQLHMVRKVKAGRLRQAAYILYLVGGAYLTVAYAASGQAGWAAFLASLTGGFAVFAPALSRWLVARNVRRYVNKFGDAGIVGPVTLTLSGDSLMCVTETQRTETPWDKVVGLEETPDHLFILVTSLSAAIVPRHAFATPEGYAAIREFAQAKVRLRSETAPLG